MWTGVPILWALGLGCSSSGGVESLAVAACEIPPGVVTDGVGQALGRGVIDPEELAIWDVGGSSTGLDTIGPAGLGVLRANSRCKVTGRTREGSNHRITLVREEPDLDAQAEWSREEVQDLPTVQRVLEVEVLDTPEGLRVHLDLARAQGSLAEARSLAAQEQWQAALAALEVLEAWFPDPLLAWEREALAQPTQVAEPSEQAEPSESTPP